MPNEASGVAERTTVQFREPAKKAKSEEDLRSRIARLAPALQKLGIEVEARYEKTPSGSTDASSRNAGGPPRRQRRGGTIVRHCLLAIGLESLVLAPLIIAEAPFAPCRALSFDSTSQLAAQVMLTPSAFAGGHETRISQLRLEDERNRKEPDKMDRSEKRPDTRSDKSDKKEIWLERDKARNPGGIISPRCICADPNCGKYEPGCQK